MNLWSIFITGLFAGGASCAAVQGGLLVASVSRRSGGSPSVPRPTRLSRPRVRSGGKNARRKQQLARARYDRAAAARRTAVVVEKRPFSEDLVPVGGFLAGKLASHIILGFLLGLFGSSVQFTPNARAIVQIAAGVFMVLVGAHLAGAPGLGWVVPKPPAALTRLVRKSARSEAAFAPALLGFLTVLIPCGVTLTVMFLAVASGSPLWGAAGMATFVIGTSPLFAAIGYAVRRTSKQMGRTVAALSAAAVLVVGVLAINTGLVLRGSAFTLSSLLNTGPSAPAALAPIDANGTQQLRLEARSTSYSPSRVGARAGVPTVLTIVTNGTSGCTRAFVIPSMGLQRLLPETGETRVNLGTLESGELQFTCSMGMYSGVVDVAPGNDGEAA